MLTYTCTPSKMVEPAAKSSGLMGLCHVPYGLVFRPMLVVPTYTFEATEVNDVRRTTSPRAAWPVSICLLEQTLGEIEPKEQALK